MIRALTPSPRPVVSDWLIVLTSLSPAAAGFAFLYGRRLFSGFAVFLSYYVLTFPFRGATVLFDITPLTRTALIHGAPKTMATEAMLLGTLAAWVAVIVYVVISDRKVLPRIAALRHSRLPGSRAAFVFSAIAALNVLMLLQAFIAGGGNFARVLFLSRSEALFGGSHLITSIPHKSLFIGLFGLYMAMAYRNGRRRGALYAAGLLVVSSILLLLLMGQRAEIAQPLIVALLAAHALSGRRLPSARVILIVVGLITASTAIGELRNRVFSVGREGGQVTVAELTRTGRTERSVADKLVKGLNLNTFDHFAILVHDFDGGDLRGLHFWRRAQGLIPRSLWPEKPQIINSGAWFSQYYYGSIISGMPFGTVGEWWLNFGVLGILIGFGLTGVIFKVLDNTLLAPETPPIHRFVLAVFLVQLFPKGLTPIIVQGIIMNFVPFFFAMGLIFTGTRESRVSAEAGGAIERL